jgi:hypothetical protein
LLGIGLAVGLALVAGALVAGLLAACGGGGGRPAAHPERCAEVLPESARECYMTEFEAMVAGRSDPRPAVQVINDLAWREGGWLLSSCHGLMHTVGRMYAADQGVTLTTLMDHLPRSNDPGCSAGFAHGLVTGVAPTDAGEAKTVCAAAATRYQRYSCVHGLGHAFMRMSGDRLPPALGLCEALGRADAADCAQGAYHDYWFAVVGADEATLPDEAVTDPRKLCAGQPPRFVLPCWYRAYVDNRPAGIVVDSPDHLEVLCEGLAGLQRSGCITAVSVIGPVEPAVQLGICGALPSSADAASCVRGVKVQNLATKTDAAYVRLIRGCDGLTAARLACYRRLGKTIAVVTDGAFGETGCPALASAAQRACEAGARSMGSALVTFS